MTEVQRQLEREIEVEERRMQNAAQSKDKGSEGENTEVIWPCDSGSPLETNSEKNHSPLETSLEDDYSSGDDSRDIIVDHDDIEQLRRDLEKHIEDPESEDLEDSEHGDDLDNVEQEDL